MNGRDIAVEVRVGEAAGSSTDLGGSSATPESGSEGRSWGEGAGGTGTPSEPGNGSSDAARPRGYSPRTGRRSLSRQTR